MGPLFLVSVACVVVAVLAYLVVLVVLVAAGGRKRIYKRAKLDGRVRTFVEARAMVEDGGFVFVVCRQSESLWVAPEELARAGWVSCDDLTIGALWVEAGDRYFESASLAPGPGGRVFECKNIVTFSDPSR